MEKDLVKNSTFNTLTMPFLYLMSSQELRAQNNISRFVDTMNIAKSCSYWKHWTDGAQSFEDIVNLNRAIFQNDTKLILLNGVNLLRLCIKSISLDICIVNTIFLSSCNANFHFQPDFHGCYSCEVLDTCSNVLLIKLFWQVQHVTWKERLIVLLWCYLFRYNSQIQNSNFRFTLK